MSGGAIRRVLGGLWRRGVLIEYRLHAARGQRVLAYAEDGVPTVMRLGTARMLMRRLEETEWWGAKEA